MFEFCSREFDLFSIMESGQAFRIRRLGQPESGTFLAAAGKRAAAIRQEPCPGDPESVRLTFSCAPEEFESFWRDYFDLDRDYGAIRRSVDPGDAFLREAAELGRGVRILHQDLWETIVSFLISQNNNIPRIRNSIEALCRRYGEEIRIPGAEGESCFSFPAPERIREGGPEGLQGLGLGYRDKYILKMAERCSGDGGREWLKRLSAGSYETSRQLLLEEFGIGKKVADCICLFALRHVEAYPVDTHIRQILDAHYPEGFPFERYEGYAGILQQYLFFAELKSAGTGWSRNG